MPPARAGPLTAAIVGTGASSSRVIARTIGDESGAPVRRSLRSAPAQNAGGAWSSTIARASPAAIAASATSSAALSPVTSRVDSALRFSGEFSVIVATPSATAARTASSDAMRCIIAGGHARARNASTSARSRVRRIGGRALTMSHR